MFPLLGWGRCRQQQKTQNTHLALETDQTLQDNCMFTYVHLMQKEGWHLIKKVIVTHINSFSKQQEHKGMISLSKKMIIISLLY